MCVTINMQLLIVESPAKIKTIQKILGRDYVIKATLGHVKDLKPQTLSIDIEKDYIPSYAVIKGKSTILKDLKSLAKRAERIWLATDNDLEGEAIAAHVLQTFETDKKKAARITFNEITPQAITEAISKPREVNYNLFAAQQARRVTDRLIGFELSPLLWKHVSRGTSVGRVQTVGLKLICDRENEIDLHQPETSFEVTADFIPGLHAKYVKKVADLETVKSLMRETDQHVFRITQVAQSSSTKSPPAPFVTSSMQMEAHRTLGFSPAFTMKIAQRLYEQGRITYMRTDSVNVASDAKKKLKEMIIKNWGEAYHADRVFAARTSNAQDAHECIRPCDPYLKDDELEDATEKRLYKLIWRRTLQSQMSAMKTEHLTIHIGFRAGFVATAKHIVFDGFTILSETRETNDTEYSRFQSAFKQHQILKLEICNGSETRTRPSARYTESSLIKELESRGIGRPSTYASTLATLDRHEYTMLKDDDDVEIKNINLVKKPGDDIVQAFVVKKVHGEKKRLRLTDLGRSVEAFVRENFPRIIDYEFTKDLEDQMDAVGSGTRTYREVVHGVRQVYKATLEDLQKRDISESTVIKKKVIEKRYLGAASDGSELYVMHAKYGPCLMLKKGKKVKFHKINPREFENMTLPSAIEVVKQKRDSAH